MFNKTIITTTILLGTVPMVLKTNINTITNNYNNSNNNNNNIIINYYNNLTNNKQIKTRANEKFK